MASVETDAEIKRLYAAAFNRTPDTIGLQYWDAAADDGLTLSNIAGLFAGSPEFIQRYGPLDDDGFVRQLYRNILGREGEQTGITYWDNALANGFSRGSTLNGFAQSPENIAHIAILAAPPPVVTPPPAVTPPPVVTTPPPVTTTPPPVTVPPPVESTPPPVVTPPSIPSPLMIGSDSANATFEIANGGPPGDIFLVTSNFGEPSKLILDHPPPGELTNNLHFSGRGPYASGIPNLPSGLEFNSHLELGDLQFDAGKYTTNHPEYLSGDGQSFGGGTVTLTNHGAVVYKLDNIFRTQSRVEVGVDPTTGHNFVALQ